MCIKYRNNFRTKSVLQYLYTKHWMFSKAIFSVTFPCFSYPESMHADVVDRVLSLPECVSVCRGWWVARCSRCTDNDWTRRGPVVQWVSLMNVTHPYCSDSAEARCSQTWCLFPEWRQLVPSGFQKVTAHQRHVAATSQRPCHRLTVPLV